MMNDPKDPFYLTRGKVFAVGTGVTLLVAAGVWFFVPAAPTDKAISAPLAGAGSQTAALAPEKAIAETDSSAASSSPDAAVASAPAVAEGNPSASAPSQTATETPPATPVEAHYTKFCAQCHGEDGLGKTQMARMMEGGVPSLIEGPFRLERSVEVTAALIRQGSQNKRMPGFEKELSQEDAEALAAHVLAFPETKKPKETK
jgi:mono/diheme cytochrome c family protein